MNLETGKSGKITNMYLSLTQLEHCSSLNAAAQENLNFSNINFSWTLENICNVV